MDDIQPGFRSLFEAHHTILKHTSFGDFEKKLKTYKADVAKTSSKTPKKITKLTIKKKRTKFNS